MGGRSQERCFCCHWSSFPLDLPNMNVWGLKFESETVAVRMEAIKTFLKNSLYDLVLVQEAWYNEDYRILASAFPYATNYGTPGSLLCPPATRDEGYHLQLLPVDCNGVVLLSRKNSLVPQHRLGERVGCAERSLCCYTEGEQGGDGRGEGGGGGGGEHPPGHL